MTKSLFWIHYKKGFHYKKIVGIDCIFLADFYMIKSFIRKMLKDFLKPKLIFKFSIFLHNFVLPRQLTGFFADQFI